jgi:ssDNA-binding replication factor A large subunit
LNEETHIEKISTMSGKPEKEIKTLIEKKKEKFSGLLTDSGATYMVAKELGINLNQEQPRTKENKLTISELQEGLSGVEITARVLHIFAPKKFEKNGKKGVLCNLLLGDKTGQVRATLWHEQVKKFFELGIQRGDCIQMPNCTITKYNEKPQISIGNGDEISITENNEKLGEFKTKLTEITKLTPNMTDVDVIGIITQKFEEKKFKTQEREGKLISFYINDTTGNIRAVAWNDLTEEIKQTIPGNPILIEGAYTKENNNKTELHLGWQSRILMTPKKNKQTEKLKKLNQLQKKKISQAQEGEHFHTTAKITSLESGKLYYLCCENCGKKTQQTDGEHRCENCGKTGPKPRAVCSAEINDETTTIKTVFFGTQAEKLLGKSAEELEELYEEQKTNEFIEQKNKELRGQNILLHANAKKREGNMELIANNIELLPEKKEVEIEIKNH